MTTSAIYTRVSTREQADKGTSLDTQVEAGLTKAAELGWHVPPDLIIKEDWTGKDLGRPGLLRLFDLATSRRVEGVIFHTPDRLYRPANDGDEWRVFEVLDRLQTAGVEVAWVDATIPFGRTTGVRLHVPRLVAVRSGAAPDGGEIRSRHP